MNSTKVLRLDLPSRAILVLCTALASCGGDGAPTIVRFEVDRSAVAAGETVTLSWKVEGAATVRITAEPGGELLAPSATLEGTKASGPIDAATTFRLTASSEDGEQSTASKQVTVTGLRIASFVATPMAIPRGGSAVLSWQIGGSTPTAVVITDSADAIVYSGAAAMGTQSVSPAAEETYTLRAEAGTLSDEATVTVSILAEPPAITLFEAVENPILRGASAELSWETVNAAEVQVSQDGTVRRPWTSNGAARGRVQLQVDTAQSTFLLEARNPDGTVSSSVTVSTIQGPEILTFTVSPTTHTRGSTLATLAWSTVHATTVGLSVNGEAVSSFPSSTLSGSFSLEVVGAASLRLTASNEAASVNRSLQITLGYDEAEPNDGFATAIPLPGDGLPVRGTLSSTTDVDLYAVMVPAGARITAHAGLDEMGSCAADTRLSLFVAGSTVALGVNEEVEYPDIAPCAFINPLPEAWADELAAGVYYVEVSGHDAGPTQYSLVVDVSGPDAGVPFTATPIGNPLWEPVTAILVAMPLGTEADGFQYVAASLDRVVRPLHYFNYDFYGILTPEAAHNRSYETELLTGAAVGGLSVRTTFTVEEFSPPNAVYLFLMVVPKATAPVGSTMDYSSGPMIPNSVYPMDDHFWVDRDGVLWDDDPPAEHPGYDVFVPVVPGAGASHRILAYAENLEFGPGNTPATGNYVINFDLTDAGGNGYHAEIPFVVQ